MGETVLENSLRYSLGGKGANEAFAVGSLGGRVEILGCVGKDSFGTELVQNLSAANVKKLYGTQYAAEKNWVKQ